MNKEEKQEVYNTALSMASRHGAVLTGLLLKSAQAPVASTGQQQDEGSNLGKTIEGWSNDLATYGDKHLGPGMGNYLSTGTLMGGLGALYGLLFGDKKKGTLDAMLNNALLFGGLGLGGQYLRNQFK